MRSTVRWLATAPLVAGALVAAGCSTAPPTATMTAAEVAVRDAEESGAGERAALELRLAREKLDSAKRALDDHEWDLARRLAEEAYVDAQLAEVRARSAEARADAENVRRTADAVRDEANGPARPPY
jgi:hypothetical protein